MYQRTLVAHSQLAGAAYSDGLATSTELQLWIFGGMFLFGAVTAYVSARYRLITPFVVAAALYGWALATSWSSMVDSAQSSGAGITSTIFEIGLGFWPALLVIALVIGGVEYGIRRVVTNNRSTAAT